MSKPREFSDGRICPGRPAPGQMHLPLERPIRALPEPRDLHQVVKSLLAKDTKECRFSREEIARRISVVTGKAVSISMLDAMIAGTKEHRFPAEWVAAWVMVTGSRRLLDLLCEEAGFYVADMTMCDLAELARLRIEAKKASARAEELRRSLWDRV